MNLLQRIIILSFPLATFSIGIYTLFNLTSVKLKVTYSCPSKNISEIWKLNSTEQFCYLENTKVRTVKPAEVIFERNYAIPIILIACFMHLFFFIRNRRGNLIAICLGFMSVFIFLFLLVYGSIDQTS